MPEEEKVKKSEIPVDIDTSGPEVDVAVEEPKEEACKKPFCSTITTALEIAFP